MSERSNGNNIEDLRQKIIGLGEKSQRKSYYPQLHKRISELEQALAALGESETKYRTLVENVNVGIFRSIASSGKITHANTAFLRIFGYSDDATDINALDLYPNRDDRIGNLSQLAAQVSIKSLRTRLKRVDGTDIICSLTLTARFRPDGEIDYIDGVVEDITEKEHQEEALRQANNKLNLLSSITRHDVNNQLMAIEGFLELASQRITDPLALDYLAKVKANANSIGRQQAFTKDYQEIGVKEPQWISLGKSISSALLTVDKAQLKINVEVGEYEVFADPMITKVFFNIGSNVNRHAQASNLFITTREENGLLLLSFADDGIGIGKKDRLFTRGSSFGYGLFLSKEILAITGISIKEVGIPGKGATFEMTFPQDRFRHTPVRQYMSRITV